MPAQILVALLNPQLHIAALVVVALTIVCIYAFKYYCQMDPELAKVRALQKVINRTLPKRRRRDEVTGADCLKSAITALGAATPAERTPKGPEDERQAAAEDGSENNDAALDDP